MCAFAVCLVCVSLLLRTSLGCFRCLVEVSDGLKMCWGHVWSEFSVRNVDSCFRKVDRIFNNNKKLIEAAQVGEGHHEELKKLMNAEVLPIVEDFDLKENPDTVYEKRLQKAANRFIASASKLPRVSGCFPPCGFQIAGAVYNCKTCLYDSCEFPLDCPIKEINATENGRSQIWCKVPFHLPDDAEVVWRVAKELKENIDATLVLNMRLGPGDGEASLAWSLSGDARVDPYAFKKISWTRVKKVKTQQVNEFQEVTAGLDRLYSIPSTGHEHQGTYQCEIFTGNRSIVRLYFHLTVISQVLTGHTELQEIFDLSLLPGGQLIPAPRSALRSIFLPWSLLLITCLTTSLMLLYLSVRVLVKDAREEANDFGDADMNEVVI